MGNISLAGSCVDPPGTQEHDPHVQALEKWGNWGQIAPGVSNGQSEIKFTKLEFARPETVAAQFDPDEGFTGDVLVYLSKGGSSLCTLRHLLTLWISRACVSTTLDRSPCLEGRRWFLGSLQGSYRR